MVEEGPGFLSFESCVVKADAVHGIHGARLFAHEQAGGTRRKLLEFADPLVHSLQDCGRFELLSQRGSNGLPHGIAVHGLGEHLEGENVVVAIDNQTRQEIALAEDNAVGISVMNEFLAVRDSGGNSLPQQGCEITHWLVGEHADRYLRGTAVKCRAQESPAFVRDAHQRSRRNAFCGNDVRPIDPYVTILEAGCAARRDFDGRGSLG